MSQTMSEGLVSASRWAGMAVSMDSYLGKWLTSDEPEGPTLQKGIFAAAERFLNHVLQGIALDRGVIEDPSLPPMAGISNLTIAIEILAEMQSRGTLQWDRPATLPEVEITFRSYRDCIQAIRNGLPRNSLPIKVVEELQKFFRELHRQGALKRYETSIEAL